MRIYFSVWYRKGAFLIDDGLLVLNMLRYRLFLPIDVVVDRIFQGNRARAQQVVDDLEKYNLIEYATGNQITITSAGRMALNKQPGNNRSFA